MHAIIGARAGSFLIKIKAPWRHRGTLRLSPYAFPARAIAAEAIMNALTRLLLICHPDLHPSPAMARAQALAKATGATLHLVVLSQLPSRLITLDQMLRSSARKQDAEHRKAWLHEQAQALGEQGITAYPETLDDDDPLKDLIRLAQLHHVEMLIKDIRHETVVSRALLTPLDWQLLRRCPIPLHLVAQAEAALPGVSSANTPTSMASMWSSWARFTMKAWPRSSAVPPSKPCTRCIRAFWRSTADWPPGC